MSGVCPEVLKVQICLKTFVHDFRYIQYFDEGLNSSFVWASGEKFAVFCTNTSSKKLIDK